MVPGIAAEVESRIVIMKKLFSRTPDQQSLVGKVLNIGNHVVEVCDIVAEGKHMCIWFIAQCISNIHIQF